MTEYEHILNEIAKAIANAIRQRCLSGKPGLPPWREKNRTHARRRRAA